jgi:hypothetical protein
MWLFFHPTTSPTTIQKAMNINSKDATSATPAAATGRFRLSWAILSSNKENVSEMLTLPEATHNASCSSWASLTNAKRSCIPCQVWEIHVLQWVALLCKRAHKMKGWRQFYKIKRTKLLCLWGIGVCKRTWIKAGLSMWFKEREINCD